jgi:hypothetical protein
MMMVGINILEFLLVSFMNVLRGCKPTAGNTHP